MLGPCYRIGPDDVLHHMISGLNDNHPDEIVAVDASPWTAATSSSTRCSSCRRPVPAHASADRPVGAPHASGRVVPAGERDRPRRVRLEVSFFPGGRWMAVARVAIGVGEGERTLEIAVRPAVPVAACR